MQPPPTFRYETSPPVSSAALNALFATAWPHHKPRDFDPVLAQSLGYICAYDADRLVGFVNVAWDGGVHGFILDTTVHRAYQRQGIGQQLMAHAADLAAHHHLAWLHVDFEPHLTAFYRACGYQPTEAGLLRVASVAHGE